MQKLSVLPKNTTQCPRQGLEPGPLDPETSALTIGHRASHRVLLVPDLNSA